MTRFATTPPPPGPPRPFVPPSFQQTVLPSGLRIRAARWGKRPTVAASLLVAGAGSAGDPIGLEGTAEIAAETFLGGTSRLNATELAEAIDDLAAIVEVSSGVDSSVARLFVLPAELEAGLTLFAQILVDATFPEDEFDKNRRRQIDLLAEQRSEPDFLAKERLLDRLYPDHPYGRFTASEAGLQRMTRDDVQSFVRSRYDLGKATLVLVGDVDPERLLRVAEKVFGALPKGTEEARTPDAHGAPPVVTGFSIHLVHRPGSVQTNLLFARPAIKRSDPLYPAAIVANQTLGGGASSRLFNVLREERGLTYGAFSSLVPRLSGGHFSASIDCRTEVTHESLDGLLRLIRAFSESGPTEDEHQRSLKYILGSFVLARETPGAIAQDEVTRLLHALPDDEFHTWRDRVMSVTRSAATETASSLFDPATGVVAAVGDAAVIRPVLDKFGETTLWDADGPRVP